MVRRLLSYAIDVHLIKCRLYDLTQKLSLSFFFVAVHSVYYLHETMCFNSIFNANTLFCLTIDCQD